jgi:Bacterial PH domain
MAGAKHQTPERRPEKARIHTGGVRQPQHRRHGDRHNAEEPGLIMRYIDNILQPGETVAFTTTLHWIVYLPAIGLWFLAFIAISVGGAMGPVAILTAIVCALVGSGLAFSAWFRRWTTEIDVTDRRIVFKRGFIRRHTVEMNMDKVESVDVDQSILGRMLDYGDITIRGTGIEPLRNIDSPLEFRNAVTAR